MAGVPLLERERERERENDFSVVVALVVSINSIVRVYN